MVLQGDALGFRTGRRLPRSSPTGRERIGMGRPHSSRRFEPTPIHVDARGWPDCRHWQVPADPLAADGHGIWLSVAAG